MKRGAVHLVKKTLKTILLANQENLTYGQESRMRAFQERHGRLQVLDSHALPFFSRLSILLLNLGTSSSEGYTRKVINTAHSG